MCPLREEAREKSVCRYVNVAASPTNKAKAEAEAGRTRWTGRSSVYAKGKALSCSYVATPRSRSHRAMGMASAGEARCVLALSSIFICILYSSVFALERKVELFSPSFRCHLDTTNEIRTVHSTAAAACQTGRDGATRHLHDKVL